MAMDKILVHGGATLRGNVRISGSKNSALPILAAALLTKEQCIIHHVPDLSDINYMLQILSHARSGGRARQRDGHHQGREHQDPRAV